MSTDDKDRDKLEVLHQDEQEEQEEQEAREKPGSQDEWDDMWADEEDDEEWRQERERRSRTIRSAVVFVVVAALIINVLAFWPKIYNMETLPFLFKSRELSSREDIQSYKEAIVLVGTDRGKGTGFHVADGYIVTNYHVIEDTAYTLVSFPGNDKSYAAEIAASAPELDVAILQIEPDGLQLPHIELEQETQWQSGDPIYIIGNPLYFTQIANEGKVLGLVPLHGRQSPVLALDAPVFKGNSGSPVINERGKAIAVVYATGEIVQEGETVQAGFAVPIEDWGGMLRGLSAQSPDER